MPAVISARDNPGTLREFETVLILRPDTLQEGVLELNNKIKELIEADEGRMLLVENWGKRRLAYEIRKQLKGIYMYYQFLGHGPLIKEMERNFRLTESVIRHFTTRIDENVDPDARPDELSEEDFLAAAATRPDEEELATGYVMTGTGEKIPVSRLGYEKRGEPVQAPGTTGSETAPTAEAAPTQDNAVTEAPEAVTEAPEAVTEAPVAVTEAPEAVTEAPKEASAPEAVAETPDEAPAPEAETPDTPDEAPAPEAVA